jgi:hypothetical protein
MVRADSCVIWWLFQLQRLWNERKVDPEWNGMTYNIAMVYLKITNLAFA